MKIELPENSKNKVSVQKTPIDNTEKKDTKRTSKKPSPKHNPNAPISWREKDGFVTAIISRKLIKIDSTTFDIHLPNGFKISNNKSLEESKKKAIEFFAG